LSLAGEIGEIAFSDLVQLCSQIKCTGTLVLSAPTTGEVLGFFGFEQGELYDARLGSVNGLEAVYRALELTEGAFHVDVKLRSPQRRIFTSIGVILLEGMRRLDEAHRAAARAAPPPAAEEVEEIDAEIEEVDAMSILDRPTVDLIRAPSVTEESESARMTIEPRSRSKTLRWIPLVLVGAAVGVAATWAIQVRRAKDPSHRTAWASVGPGGAAASLAGAPGALSGVTDDEVLFGMAAPFSGTAKELGRQMKLGIDTAFREINDGGGVGGRHLRLAAVDDGYEPSRTLGAMKELADKQRVFAVVGNVGTPTAAVALPFALEHKMLFYGAFTGASLLRRDPPDRYVFNYRASYAEETAAVVHYLVKVRHIRPEWIAVFAQQDSFGDAGFTGVTKALRAMGSEPKFILRVGYKRNTVDVKEAVDRLRERSVPVRAVVMVATYRAAARFIEKVRDISPKMIFTNVSFVGSTALAEELGMLGPRYASGVIVTQVVPPIESYSTAVLKYKTSLGKYAPGEKPDYVSLEGYLAAQILAEGLRRTGPKLDTERLVTALEGIHDLDMGLGTSINFGLVEHQGSHKVWGTRLNDAGKYEVIDLE
jgi:ABC-type branched-subunit amino acid transport system substrate-binding protein